MDARLYITSLSNVPMPRLIYGTAWKKDRTADLVHKALQEGFRGIDTACQPRHYHEAGVGEGIAAAMAEGLSRSELYLQSKFTPVSGQDPDNIPYDPSAPLADQVIQSLAASLRNLKTDYLDGLLLHSPIRPANDLTSVWQTLEALVDSGKVRQIGISNCYSPKLLASLYQAARVKPALVQNRFYAETGYDRDIRLFCRREGIVYQSFWTLSANPHILRHSLVTQLASQYQRTPAQILFRYLTEADVVPLTGTASEAHMREDLEIFNFQLNPEECRSLSTLFHSA